MADLPDLIFIIDTNKEHIAVEEASTLRIPVVAILDSNSDPRGISYAVPGNDDAIRAVSLYCELAAGAVLDGLEREMVSSGVDIGGQDQPVAEVPPEGAQEEVGRASCRGRVGPYVEISGG